MSGQSGKNLKIAKSRLGCRLPFESSAVGNGYASSGPLVIRKMTDEERARYGPARPRPSDDGPYHARIMQAVKVSDSYEEAAELLNMKVAQLKRYLGAKGIYPKWGAQKPEEEVFKGMFGTDNQAENMPKNMPISDAIGQVSQEAQENENFQVSNIQENPDATGQQTQETIIERPKTRMEIAREKLSIDEYLRLKEEGKTDNKIKSQFKIASDVLTKLKREWGLPVGVALVPQKLTPASTENAAQPDPVPEPKPAPPSAGLTIARALELRTELAKDIECLEKILDAGERGTDVTEGVWQLLVYQRDIHRAALDRLNEAFARTVVQL